MKNITFKHPVGFNVYEGGQPSNELSLIVQELLSNEDLILEVGDQLEGSTGTYEVTSITYRHCDGSLVGIDFRTIKK